MTNTATARALVSAGMEWREGMRVIANDHPAAWCRLLWQDGVGRWNACGERGAWLRLDAHSLASHTPDLTDDATVGILESDLFRLDPGAVVSADRVHLHLLDRWFIGTTETRGEQVALALTAALREGKGHA